MTLYRALSVRQPWADLILNGTKTIENLSWKTTYRGPLVIHAGRRWDPAGPTLAQHIGAPCPTDLSHCATGTHLGIVDLIDIHEATDCEHGCSPWASDTRYHWELAHHRRFPIPVPAKGTQGLMTVSAALPKDVLG